MEPLGRAAPILVAITCALIVATVAPVPSQAEDSERIRYYLDVRFGESNPAVKAEDHIGFSLGVNLGLHLGAELSADFYELKVKANGVGIGEYGIGAFAPLVRLRYPLLERKLVPYVLAGAGVAVGQFNDRKEPAFGASVDADKTVPIGVVGAGIEYFIADNLAFDFQTRYIAAGDQSFEFQGTRHKQNISTSLITAGLRMFYPELRPAPPVEAEASPPARLYFGVKVGGAVLTDSQIFSGVGTSREPPAFGGAVDTLYGLAAGLTWGRYFGVELSLEGFETNVTLPGVGAIGEYAVYTVLPQFRLRYPLLRGALQPYVLGGVGLGYAEFNDRKRPRSIAQVSGDGDFTLAASVGAGVDYFIVRNIAASLETKFETVRDQSLKVNGGPTQEGNINAFLFSLGLRIFLADLWR